MGKRIIQEIQSYIDNIDYINEVGYIKSGFELIDDANEGLEEFGTTVICARPNVGKTLLGQNIAVSIAKQGHKVAFFSYEMNMQRLQDRFFQMVTGLRKNEMLYLWDSRREDFNKIINKIKRTEWLDNIIVYESVDFKTAEDIRRIMTEDIPDIKYFVMDYLQRLRPIDERDDERITIAKSSMVLHELCINNKKQGIILTQASVSDKGSTEMKFTKGSTNVEEDAEVGILLEHLIDSNGMKTISAYMYKNKNGDKCHHRYLYKIDSRLNFVKQSNA